MRARLNEIKDREDFRSVAPVVLEEKAAQWFVNATVSPFMLFAYDVRPEQADRIPAVRHIDGTARIQTIKMTARFCAQRLLGGKLITHTSVSVVVLAVEQGNDRLHESHNSDTVSES